MNTTYEPIAIVGMGIRVPQADDVDEFWKIMEEKRDMTKDIPKDRFNTEFWCSKEKMKGSSVRPFMRKKLMTRFLFVVVS